MPISKRGSGPLPTKPPRTTPNYGLPKLPAGWGQDFLNSLPSGGPTAPDFFGPLANSPELQAMANGGAPAAPGGGGFDATSNPYYQQTLAAINASGAADAAQTRAAIQQALVGFGFVPTGFKDKMGALDDATKALIQKNTDTGISGYARLLEGRSEGIKDLVNRLQSRGLRRSGARGALLKKNQLGFDRNFADAVANLLGQTGNAYSQYAQNEAARQNQLAQAMAWVYQNYYTGPGSSTPSGGSSSSSSSSSSSYGPGYAGYNINDKPVYGAGTEADPYHFQGGGFGWY